MILKGSGSRMAWACLSCVCVSVLWFLMLGNRPLFDPDEGRYAEIPREMLEHGDWVIPHLDGLVYLEKPPLQYWLTAFGFQFFGESDGVARLVPGIAGYLSLFVLYFLGRRLWGAEAGLKAVLLAGASLLFVLLGHQLTLDMLLCFWLLTSLGCFVVAQLVREDACRCRRWMLGCWAGMAFAVLTKGLIGILIPAASLTFYALWQKDWRTLATLHVRWGLPLLVALAAPWFVLAARANPQFLEFFFIREHFLRFLTPVEQRSEAWWFFIPVVALGILPWLPLAGRALVSTWRRSEPAGRFDPARLLWVWCVFIFIFFSASNAKLITYVLPLVPTLALLSARPSLHEAASIRVGAVLSLAASVGIMIYASGMWSSPFGVMLARQMLFGLRLTAGVLAVAAISSLVLLRRSCALRALSALCVGWFLAAAGLLIAAGEVQRVFSGREAAQLLKAVVPPDSPIYSVQYYEQSLPFYLRRTVVLVDYRDEFALGLDATPQAGIANLDQFAERWRNSSDGYAIMRLQTYELLEARGLAMHELARVRRSVIVSRR
jgi:4-amino-4-deoxy-L-arabinose transferase-like glycosyltransferase